MAAVGWIKLPFLDGGFAPNPPRGHSVGTPGAPLRGREARCARLILSG